MSEKQFNPPNINQNDIEQEETERKKKALDWLLFRVGMTTDQIPDPNAPENPEKVVKLSTLVSSDANSEYGDQRRFAIDCYLWLAKEIGPSPSANPQLAEMVTKLKQQIKNKPETLELLKKYADPRWLNNFEPEHMIFLDSLYSSLPTAVARIYYPERFKYLTDGLIEIDDLSIDEIYSCYLTLLQKCINLGKSKGYSENEKGGDSLGTYLAIYKKLTEK